MSASQIRCVGVAGAAGTMGAGIAIVAARAGFKTICYDLDATALDGALARSRGFLDKSVERNRLTPEARDAAVANLSATTHIDDLADCDLVIEAVFESLDVKRELLAQLDACCSPHTLFASNTSTLSITEIAAGCSRPDRVVGLHFCLPAQMMKLIEVSPGVVTAQETFDRVWAWAQEAGQKPVRTEDRPGFILNALLVPFNNDAIRAVEAGVASAEDIDKAIKVGLGYKMGPLELIDLIGLDTQVLLCKAFYPVTLDPRAATPPLLNRMVAAGFLGRKSGRGFYTYDNNAMFGG